MFAARGGFECSTSASLVGSEEAELASAGYMAVRDVGSIAFSVVG